MNKHWKRIPANEKRALRQFGVKTYRPSQRELIQAVLSGNDTLGIMPTGNGKSLCYQLPARFLPYAVLVRIPADLAHNEEIKRTLVGGGSPFGFSCGGDFRNASEQTLGVGVC